MTVAGSRFGWRLRALVRRHLAVHGGWYAAEHARVAPSPDVASLLAAFLAAQPAPGTDLALVERLGAELEDEWQRRDVAADSPLGRLTTLAVRAGLGRAGGDLLTAAVGGAVDRTYAWFVRTVTGGTGGTGLPRWLLDDLVDPLGAEPAAVGAAWDRAVALGLVDVDGLRAVPTPAALRWIVSGDVAPLPPGVREHGAALCARRDDWRAAVLPETGAVSAERRIVVAGGRDQGAGWIAAATARDRNSSVLAADAAAGVAAGPALAAAALVRNASVLLEAAAWDPALVPLVSALPLPVVVSLPADDVRQLAAAARDLGAATVELPVPTRAHRAAWWTQLLDATEGLGPRPSGEAAGVPTRHLVASLADSPATDAAASVVGGTHLAAYPLPLETIFEIGAAVQPPVLARLDRAACAASGSFDPRCRRLAPSLGAEATLPAELGPAVAALRRQLDGGAPGAIRLASDTPAAAAAALCTAAGVELFELAGARLCAAPEGSIAHAADVLAQAAERGAAVLLTGLDALPADDVAALAALLATPAGIVIVPVNAGVTSGTAAAPRRLQL